jgi:hypothetical protein
VNAAQRKEAMPCTCSILETAVYGPCPACMHAYNAAREDAGEFSGLAPIQAVAEITTQQQVAA